AVRCACHALSEGLGIPVTFRPGGGSVERREAGTAAVDGGIELTQALGAAMKYPTVTKTVSPNQVLRDRLNLAVIHRPCRTYPGVSRNYTGTIDLHVGRVAAGGTYEDAGIRLGRYSAVSSRVMERIPVEHAAHFAFRLAERHRHSVVSTSKYTIQRAADGLFEEIVDEVAKEYRNTEHRRELFDSLLAKVIINPEQFDVIVCPNEYGDFLSDAVYGLIGSIGLGASASYAFTPSHQPIIGIFDPAGGTAPDIAGKGIATPAGSIEAYGYLLEFFGQRDMSKRLIDSVRDCIASGEKTADLGGTLNTMEFTKAVIK